METQNQKWAFLAHVAVFTNKTYYQMRTQQCLLYFPAHGKRRMAHDEASHKSKAEGPVQNIGGRRALIYQQDMCGRAPWLLYVFTFKGELRSEPAVSAICINTHCWNLKYRKMRFFLQKANLIWLIDLPKGASSANLVKSDHFTN